MYVFGEITNITASQKHTFPCRPFCHFYEDFMDLSTHFPSPIFCQATRFPLCEGGPLRRDSDNNGR